MQLLGVAEHITINSLRVKSQEFIYRILILPKSVEPAS